jgi:hypothetical protein
MKYKAHNKNYSLGFRISLISSDRFDSSLSNPELRSHLPKLTRETVVFNFLLN